MPDNDDVLVSGEWQTDEGEQQTDVTEPSTAVATREPEGDVALTREELESSAMEDAELAVTLDNLEGIDELTLDDLRTLPGAEEFSDEELEEMAVKAGLL